MQRSARAGKLIRYSKRTGLFAGIVIFFVVLLSGQASFAQGISDAEMKLMREQLKDFDKFAAKAKEHGATHIRITENIPPSLYQFDVEGDPYPAWYIYHADLMKIFPPARLQPYVNMEYAKFMASILEERCKILRKYGLKGHFRSNEPHVLPEKFFTDNPQLRGPRIDHPQRSRTARFAACVDQPEVLEMYRESMQSLLKRCPEIEVFYFATSDAGSGFCWTKALYAGRNGNSTCENRPMEDRIYGFMTTLQQAAKDVGKDIEININPIEPRQWMPATFETPKFLGSLLPKGLTIENYKNAAGETIGRGRPAWGNEAFYPVTGLSNPLSTARSLTRYYSRESSDSRMVVSYSDPATLDFNVGLFDLFEQSKPKNQAGMMQSLRNYAIEVAGEQGADDLLEIWLAMDMISNDLRVLNFGSVLSFGPILARWINRPLVPFPAELSPEEIAYYKPFLFQAKGEEQANNLIDIQAMRMFEGYGARLLVQRVYEMVMANLTKSERLAKGLLENETDAGRKAQWDLLVKQLAVLHSLVQTIDNVVAYQALLDLVRSRAVQPEQNPVLGTDASWDRQEIQRIARNEIDNAVRLKSLLESSQAPLIHTSIIAKYETIRMLGPQLPAQLKNKIDIMNKHWTDYNRLYTAPNL
jgi:hypothetical protein